MALLALGCSPSNPIEVHAPAPEATPSMSVGPASAGALVDGVRMPEGEGWALVDPERAWATHETVDFLAAVIERVDRRCPKTHKLFIGHLSRKDGGPLWPHRSHQSGRDVDLGFYHHPSLLIGWYQRANHLNLDAARSWALVRAFITYTDVEYIFIDRRVQRLLRKHALEVGEDRAWLETVFQPGSVRPDTIVRHAPGHATHMHVRFYNRGAQLRGYRAYDRLLESGTIGGRRHPRLRRGKLPNVPPRPTPPRPRARAGRCSMPT